VSESFAFEESERSIGFRLLLRSRIIFGDERRAFYFQQTLGGADINSAMSLAAMRITGFGAPNLCC